MCEVCGSFECPARCPNHAPEIVAHCTGCNEPIYYGDGCFKFPDGSMWHDDCLWEEYHTTGGE